MKTTEATQHEVREAMRTVHSAAPEAAGTLQSYLDALEERVQLLSNEDAFRAYLLARAAQDGAVQQLLTRIDNSIMSRLAEAEGIQQERSLLIAQDRKDRAMTTRQVLTQPVVLAFVTVISTVLTGLMTILLHLAGTSPP